MEPSQSQKHIRPLSARKINPIKTSARKKTAKVVESSKILRRISPKIATPSVFESSSVRNGGTAGRTLSSEFTMTPAEVNKAIVRLEREHSDLLSLYSKLNDDLLHLKTLETLEKQRKRQIEQIKAKISVNDKEKSDISSNLKICESIFKEFTKRMEKGGLSSSDKKAIILQIQGYYKQSGCGSSIESEKSVKDIQMTELWELIPRTEKLLSTLERREC